MASSAGKIRRMAEVARIFTPSSPVSTLDVFAGRSSQVQDVVNVITQPGQHAIIYGERGVGKTSLANVLEEVFSGIPQTSLRFARVNCNSSDSYMSIWFSALRDLQIESTVDGAPNPEDIRFILARTGASVLVIDELDRLDDDDCLSLLADTVKSLSDHDVDATLILVGVGDSVDELIGDHFSVGRPLVQVPMPRMTEEELAEIIDRGFNRLELRIEAASKRRVALLSEGLPHYTHLLSLYAAQRAVADDRDEITSQDIDAAIATAVAKVQHSIQTAYQTAIRSPRTDSKFREVLLACAIAQKDSLGFFSPRAVKEPMSQIMGRNYEIGAFARHLEEFTKQSRGNVLSKTGESRKYVYRFRDPILQPYVILQGVSTGLIDESLLEQFARPAETIEQQLLS